MTTIHLTTGQAIETNSYARMADGRYSVFSTDGTHRHLASGEVDRIEISPRPHTLTVFDLPIAGWAWGEDAKDVER